jgi:hypothetical protein
LPLFTMIESNEFAQLVPQYAWICELHIVLV